LGDGPYHKENTEKIKSKTLRKIEFLYSKKLLLQTFYLTSHKKLHLLLDSTFSLQIDFFRKIVAKNF